MFIQEHRKVTYYVESIIMYLLIATTLISFPTTVFAKGEELNELLQTVFYLYSTQYDATLNKTNIYYGTGFFYRNDKQTMYIVTAEHVVNDLRGKSPIQVVIHGPKDVPITYSLEELVEGNQESSWVYHDQADVAVIKMKSLSEIKRGGMIRCFEKPQLVSDPEKFVQFRERLLTYIGFPFSLGVNGNFSPIYKTSKMASGLFQYNRADKKQLESTFFILDDPAAGGFSGAPVCALSEISLGGVAFGTGAFGCLGLVHGAISDISGGKFAFIVPSWFILQTIEKADRKEK